MEYQVVFERAGSGSPEDCARVRDQLIARFKVSPEMAAAMIQRAPVIVKRGLTEEQAKAYQNALESIGAVVSSQPVFDPANIDTANTISPSAGPHTTASTPTDSSSTRAFGDDIGGIKAGTPQGQSPTPPSSAGAVKGWSPSAPPPPPPRPTGANAPPPPPPSPGRASAPPPPPPSQNRPSVGATADWWATVQVINPPFDDSLRGMTPMTAGRVTATETGFTLAHPMLSSLDYQDVHVISVFQSCLQNGEKKRYVDIYADQANRPVRLDAQFINFNSFQLPQAEDVVERISYLVRFLLQKNPAARVDLATYRFLRDIEQIKTVSNEKEVEKYCARIFAEIEGGNTKDDSSMIMFGSEAEDMRDEPDPWTPAPPPVPFDPYISGEHMMPFHPPREGFPPGMPVSAHISGEFPMPPVPRMPPPGAVPMPPPGMNPYGAPPPGMMPGMPPPGMNPYGAPPPGMMPGMPPPGMNPYGAPPPGMMPGMPPYGADPFADPSREIALAKDKAKTAVTLTIVGLVLSFCIIGLPLSIYGLIQAQKASQVFDLYQHEGDRGSINAAKIMGIIGIILFLISMIARFAR